MNSRLAALAAAALLASCIEGAPSSVVNGVAVATQNTPSTNWSSFSTFAVDPTVAVTDATGSTVTNTTVNGAQLVPTIVSNMQARGYTQVPWTGNATNADLQIKMQATLGSQSVYYPGYCGWYPYYACVPGWTYAGSYNFGTLILTMGNATGLVQGSNLPLVWTGAGYGVLSQYYTPGVPSNGANVNYGVIQAAINQMFAISPYIQK
jgi:hypothetical protein